jgi:hypothetical protein
MMFFIHEEFATFKANTSGYFIISFTCCIKRTGLASSMCPKYPACLYRTIRRWGTQNRVLAPILKQSAYDGFIVYVCVSVDYLHYRSFSDLGESILNWIPIILDASL